MQCASCTNKLCELKLLLTEADAVVCIKYLISLRDE